jgi:hypothetical protein
MIFDLWHESNNLNIVFFHLRTKEITVAIPSKKIDYIHTWKGNTQSFFQNIACSEF